MSRVSQITKTTCNNVNKYLRSKDEHKYEVLSSPPLNDKFKTTSYKYNKRKFMFGIFQDEKENLTYPLPDIYFPFTPIELITDNPVLDMLQQQYPNYNRNRHTFYSYPVATIYLKQLMKTDFKKFNDMVFSKLYENLQPHQTLKISHKYTKLAKKRLCIHTEK